MEILSPEFETHLVEILTKEVQKMVRVIEENYAIRSQYLNKKNACIYANISAPTLDNWINMGLEVSKINGSYVINTDDLNKFIAKYKI